jgi:hypothetical protein
VRHVALTHKTEAVKQGEARLSKALAKALRAIGKEVASRAKKLAKAEEDERDPVAGVDWTPVAKAAESGLTLVAKDGAKRTLAILGIEDDDAITEQTFDAAVEWAKARAAELVGKSWDKDGNLVDNPDAEMAIDSETRDAVRDAVADAIENGDSAAELGERIEGLGAFSQERALLIARTECIRANSNGQLAALKGSGVVDKKGWSVSGEESVCDVCQANEDQGGIDLDDAFDSGDDCPPSHPNCLCALTAAFDEDEEEQEDEEDQDDEEEAAE